MILRWIKVAPKKRKSNISRRYCILSKNGKIIYIHNNIEQQQ